MTSKTIVRASLACFGLSLLGCMGQEQQADDAIVQPPLPTTVEAHREQLTLLDRALDKEPGNPAYLKWAADLNAFTDKQAGLLYSFDVASGTTISVFEPTPGQFMLRESGQIGSTSALSNVRWESLGELYAHLKPGEVLPDALALADERQLVRRENPPPARPDLNDEPELPDADPTSTELIEKHATSSCTHFRDDHAGCPPAGGGGGSWCACNLTGDTYGQRTGMTHSYHRLMVYQGNISYNFRTGSSQIFGYALVQGQVWWLEGWSRTDFTDCNSGGAWGFKQGTCSLVFQRELHWGEVKNASGDQYHWGACFDNGIRAKDWHCPTPSPAPAHDLN